MTTSALDPWSATLDGLPVAQDPGGPVVVVSAHPDDEVIAIGAWLADQVGRDVRFVVATDGEASHPGSPTTTPDQLRETRRLELAEALRLLGHESPRTTHLGLRDAALAEDLGPLTSALQQALSDAALVLTPFEHDGHGDHDVVGRVVRAVAPATAAVWRYPIWRWEWTRPSDDESWLADAALLDGSRGARARKARALRAFRSQIEPLSDHPADRAVLPDTMLRRALSGAEVVIT